jgi:hypothetical protein
VRANGRAMWLWWWLGILVAGCNAVAVPNPTSHTATLILLGFTPTPATPVPTPRLLRTPVPTSVSLITLAPTPPRILTTNPVCYETAVGSLLCLGQIQNSLTVPLEQMVIRIYLVSADGVGLTEHDVAAARNFLMPGNQSPYGALFESIPEGTAGAVAVVVRAIEASAYPRYGILDLGGVKIEQQESLYHLSGQITNRQHTSVNELSLIVTLFDRQDRITGFRTYRWPVVQSLAVGESMTFSIDVIPQVLGTVRYEVIAEGKFL